MQKLGLIYIANIRMPTEKAHGIQIMEMCQAFADLGHEVTLVVPKRKNNIKDDPFKYYGVRKNFKIKKLWCLDWVKWGKLGFIVQSVTFAENVVFYTLSKKALFYTRDEIVAVFLKALGKRTVWEAHMGHKNFLTQLVINLGIPIVVISNGLKNLYLRSGMEEDKILIAPDGVNIDKFDVRESKEEVRERLGFERGAEIILYTGHLYSWKGADTLAEASNLILSGARVIFVGGTDKHAAEFREKYSAVTKISVLGKKPHLEIPVYLRAADVLILPNSSREDISRLYTSPLKLFEYMASGTPIVASDLPSLKEVIGEKDAFFFTPDDPRSLAETIDHVLGHKDEAQIKARNALEKVRPYSWRNRAESIYEFINQHV